MTRAPEIDRPGLEWLNTDQALSLEKLRGRLVLLDFWTFCCVNCLHTITVLRDLELRFEGSLLVIGIHSPKFPHEHGLKQLKQAVRRYDIQPPVIHDPGKLFRYPAKIMPIAREHKTWALTDTGHHQVALLNDGGAEVARYGDGHAGFSDGTARTGRVNGPALDAHLAQPSGLAYDARSQLLYFVDSETSSLRCLNLRNRWIDSLVGSRLFEFGDAIGPLGEAKLQHPLGITLCGEKLYVADTYNNAVKILDLNRGFVSNLEDYRYHCRDELCMPMAEPAGIACTPDQRILVVDTNNHRVVEYDLKNRTTVTWNALP